MNLGYRDSKLDRGEEGARIYQGGGAPNLLINLRSCEDRRRPHPHGGQGVANGSNFKGRSQKGGNFLVGGTWGRRRRRMRAQKGGAQIYLFDFFLSFCKKVKVF